jgi:hemoglobin/transferrin/lactoferrin receptor protein
MSWGLERRALCGAARRVVVASLAATASLLAASVVTPEAAHAQQAAPAVVYSIPAGPLNDALTAFGRQSGVQVTFLSDVASGKSSPGFSGAGSREQALNAILAGSGLTYSFPNATTVAISAPAGDAGATIDGAIALDTINVSGGAAEASSVYTPYETAAPTAHISQETIERYRGMSPADIFRGTPGVMSGEARNSGAIDVNIRGMQGMGRVAVTIDGAENAMSIYQGYQGASNRTFVDPDFIASIDVNKGSDIASRGIAGTVTMRTLEAADIVKPGETWGVRIKGSFTGNTSDPEPGARGGYTWPGAYYQPPVVTPSPDGMDRPGFLRPTDGAASVVTATKKENFDVLLGYAYRKQGNYHAGANGPHAKPVDIGPYTECGPYVCTDWPKYIDNAGIANYRAGEEVLNTQLETESILGKATLHFGDGHSLQLGYNGYRGESGDRMASAFTTERSQPVQQAVTAGSKLDTGTLRYRWKPADNDLVDLKANLWMTDLELRNQPRNAYGTKPATLGLPADYRTGADTFMWGADATNTSQLSLDRYGSVSLTYGLSWLTEDTRPRAYADIIEGWLNLRDARRDEAGAFTKAAYKPWDWLTLNGGLRFSDYRMEDRRAWANSDKQLNPEPVREENGFSPSAGVTIEPVDGVQLYVNYSNALRFPSLVETSSAYTLIVNPDISPERASNWEIGANFRKDGLLVSDDKAMLKAGYFNWNIKDYIARSFRSFTEDDGFTWYGMQIYNIARARFSGLELSGHYEYDGLTADFGANYYLDIQFCQETGGCDSKSLYGDYATNYVPPQYSANLMLSQTFLHDALTLGGRVTYMGPRAIEHGQVTSQGLSQFITQIKWEPYTLVDLFGEYKLNDNLTVSASIENLTDKFYVDPLSLVNQPAPGRTFRFGLTATLGSSEGQLWLAPDLDQTSDLGANDWSGPYFGVHGGTGLGQIEGTTTTLNGTPSAVAATESTDLDLRDSFFAGAQAGYNWQFGDRIVAGVEADFTKTDLATLQQARTTEGNLAGQNQLQAATLYQLDWVSTVRGRLGYAFEGGLLLYGTGGLAIARETATRTQFSATSSTTTAKAFGETSEETLAGWTLGVGAEYSINSNWSIKSEYSYIGFGDKEFAFPLATAGATAGTSQIVNGRKAVNSLDLHAVRAGLNYHF